MEMKTFFTAQELWELIEIGYANTTIDVKGLRKRDAKALLVLQQAVAEPIFPRIAGHYKKQNLFRQKNTDRIPSAHN